MKTSIFNYLLLLLLMPCVATTCENDCRHAEPRLEITFKNFKNYSAVYGLKDTVQRIDATSAKSWYVPLSIIADKTTIIFMSTTASDALILHYNRITKVESKTCGVEIFIENITVVQPTTFKKYLLNDANYGGLISMQIDD